MVVLGREARTPVDHADNERLHPANNEQTRNDHPERE